MVVPNRNASGPSPGAGFVCLGKSLGGGGTHGYPSRRAPLPIAAGQTTQPRGENAEDPTEATESVDIFGRYLVLTTLPVPSQPELPSCSSLAVDLSSLEPVCLRRDADPGEGIMDFLESLTHLQDSDAACLAPTLDGGVQGDASFLVSSWVAGVPVSALRSETVRSRQGAVHLAWALTQALSDLHGKYLVHGDLHPDNVLVDPTGQVRLVGIFPAPWNRPDTSLDDDAVARRYAAPEVDAGDTPTRRSDVFSLGLLLYELFEGRRLLARHRRGSLAATADLQAKIDRAVDDATQLPAHLRQVLLATLRLTPEHRPEHAGELLHRLVSTGEEVPPDAVRRQTARHTARRVVLDYASRWLPPQRPGLSPDDLLPVVAGLWRYAQLVPRTHRPGLRRGYVSATRALWVALANLGRTRDADARARVAVAVALVRRVAWFWRSRLLVKLCDEVLDRALTAGSALRGSLQVQPLDEDQRRELRERQLATLKENPRSSRALLALSVLDRGLRIHESMRPSDVKAAVLARAGMAREALVHRAEGVAAGEAPTPEDLQELVEFATAALEDRAPEAPSSHPGPAGTEGARPDGLAQRLETLAPDLEAALSSAPPAPESEGFGPIDEDESLAPKRRREPDASPYELDVESGGSTLSSGPPPLTSAPGREVLRDQGSGGTAALFAQAQTMLTEDRIEEAGAVLRELLPAHRSRRSPYRGVLLADLRRLVWRSTPPAADPDQGVARLTQLWCLATDLRLGGLATVCERLLLPRIPPEQVEELLGSRPGSVPLLEAACAGAWRSGNRDRWAYRSCQLAQALISRGQLAAGLRSLLRIPEDARPEDFERTWSHMMATAEELAGAAEELRRLEKELATTNYADYVVQRLQIFLESHPDFEPALARLAEHCLEHGMRPGGLDACVKLAQIYLDRGEGRRARSLLRRVLEHEYESDEAMLILASIVEDLAELPPDRQLFLPSLLAHEDALAAAHHQAVKALSGGPRDAPVHRLLIDLSRKLRRDPAPHRLALGLASLETGDRDTARELCAAALAESSDPLELVTRLREHPRIGEIFTQEDLAALAAPTETVQA